MYDNEIETVRVVSTHHPLTLATDGSVGYDVFLPPEDSGIFYPDHSPRKIYIGIFLDLPHCLWAEIRIRSCWDGKLYLPAGVIDSDYKGEVFLRLSAIMTHFSTPVKVPSRTPVAQLMFHSAIRPVLDHVKSLDMPTRGTKGSGTSY